MLPNSGLDAQGAKANTERQVLLRKESLLHFRGWQLEKTDSCPKANSQQLVREQELLMENFRGAQVEGSTYMKAQSAPKTNLKLVLVSIISEKAMEPHSSTLA